MIDTNSLPVFTFTRTQLTGCLLQDILPSNLRASWDGLRHVQKSRTLAQHGKGFMEDITLHSDGKLHRLKCSAVFDQERHVFIETAMRHYADNVDVAFDLSGIGFHSPQDNAQAHKALRELGNVLRYAPHGLQFDGICREFKNWARLTPIDGAGGILPAALVVQIHPSRFDVADLTQEHDFD